MIVPPEEGKRLADTYGDIERRIIMMKDTLANKKWWAASLTRAVRTICQTAVAAIGTAALLSEVNWLAVASASVLAGILSLLTSLGGLPEVECEMDGQN